MPMAAVIHEQGPPEVLRWESVEVPAPGPGEVRIRNEAVGLNFVDTYHRRGIPHPWPVPPLPVVLGFEGAGRVEEIGPGVTGFATGDRIAYALPPHGAYSQERVYPVQNLLKVPAALDHLDDRVLAASMLKGLTVQYLVRRTYRVEPGDVVLVHAGRRSDRPPALPVGEASRRNHRWHRRLRGKGGACPRGRGGPRRRPQRWRFRGDGPRRHER